MWRRVKPVVRAAAAVALLSVNIFFRLYFWSIGPAMLISAYTEWLPLELYAAFYSPLQWLVDHCPVTHARYCRLIEAWWLLDWIFRIPLWTSLRMQTSALTGVALSGTTVQEALAAYRADSRVLYAETDSILSIGEPEIETLSMGRTDSDADLVPTSSETASADDPPYLLDRIIVRFAPQAYADGQTPAAHSGTTVTKPLGSVPGLYRVELDSSTTVEQALAAYRAASAVLYAEPDQVFSIAQISNDHRFPPSGG